MKISKVKLSTFRRQAFLLMKDAVLYVIIIKYPIKRTLCLNVMLFNVLDKNTCNLDFVENQKDLTPT